MKNHPQCAEASRLFFKDYDALPYEIKQMLFEGNKCPDFDDLKAAWELAALTEPLDEDFNGLHVFEEERVEARANKIEEKRRERERAKMDKQLAKYRRKDARKTYVYEVRERTVSDERLVAMVKAEQAANMLTKRKENVEIESAAHKYYVKREMKKGEEVQKVEPPRIQQSASKQWHNA